MQSLLDHGNMPHVKQERGRQAQEKSYSSERESRTSNTQSMCLIKTGYRFFRESGTKMFIDFRVLICMRRLSDPDLFREE